MKKLYLGLLISLLSGIGNAQTTSFEWANSMGGTSNDYSITTDASDNVCVTGYYQVTADFDPSTAIYNLN